jgi:hypothetical protein
MHAWLLPSSPSLVFNQNISSLKLEVERQVELVARDARFEAILEADRQARDNQFRTEWTKREADWESCFIRFASMMITSSSAATASQITLVPDMDATPHLNVRSFVGSGSSNI